MLREREDYRPEPTGSAADDAGNGGYGVAPVQSVASAIAVVVISTHSDPRTLGAVDSILAQGTGAEIVVVNTGRGSLKSLLADRLRRVTLVETPIRRNVGAARNLGVLASRAPIVAFLASDCIASPGWTERRVEAHRRGHAMVASALRPLPDAAGRLTTACWSAYALTHTGRMPETPEHEAARYGLSYDRALFDRHGLFDEALFVGEDTEFNRRCAGDGQPLWDPEILTLHDYPHSFAGAAADQFRRARTASICLGRSPVRQLARSAVRAVTVARRVTRASAPRQLRTVRARLTMAALLACHCAGVASSVARRRRR